MATPDDDFIDDELRRQLDTCAEGDALGAVFTLRSAGAGQFLTPEDTRATAERVVERAAGSAGAQPDAVQVFANLQSFAVQGPAALVRAILAQPEVETAVANVQSQQLAMPPVERYEVPREEVEGKGPSGQDG